MENPFPAGPGSLLLTESELARVREQLASYHWYREAYDRSRARVDELNRRRPAVPVAKSRAFFESCEACSSRLSFDPYEQASHVCPRCGRQHHGTEFDLAWLRQFHEWLGKRLVEAGIVYAVGGDERYAELVRHYLRHYVTHYREYPLANNLLGPTRLFQSTYMEAFWLVDMVAAFDLTRGSAAYSQADLLGVRDLLFESAAVVRSYDEGRSNRQAFNNAGMGAVGLLYGETETIEHVLAGPHGFAYHMRESVLEDGIWYEGENYHFATLDHSLNLAEMARHRGIDLYGGESGYGSLRPMFDGPLKVMLPDLTFPSRKDSWFGRGIAAHSQVYELGYARYGDARYGGLLANAYAEGAPRASLDWRTFLYLDPQLPVAKDRAAVRQRGSERMPGTGVAVLRGDDGATYASIEYGRYGGGHGHPDRLHLTLFAGGVHWLLDPGTGWYHVPELGWYRSTIAHNTVSVDGASQTPREGRLVAFGSAAGLQCAQATVEGIASDVSARRTLVLGDGFLLDVLDVLPTDASPGQRAGSAPEATPHHRRVDWSFHTPGQLVPHGSTETISEPAEPSSDAGPAPDDAGSPGPGDGYEFLRDVRPLPPSSQLDLLARLGDATLRVIQDGPAVTGFTATAPGVPGSEEQPLSSLVIGRGLGGAQRFVTAWLWSEEKLSASLGARGDLHVLDLGAARYTFAVPPFTSRDDAGLAVAVGRRDDSLPEAVALRDAAPAWTDEAITKLAWFGLREASLPGAHMTADMALPSGALVRDAGGAWVPQLPEAFGAVQVTTGDGPAARFEQGTGVNVWRDEGGPLELFAGSVNEVRFHVGWYGLEARAPEVDLPQGWCVTELLEESGRDPGGAVRTWVLSVAVPRLEAGASGELLVLAGGRSHALPYRIVAPLAAEWRVAPRPGEPAFSLVVRGRRDAAGALRYRLNAPWLPTALTGERRLEPGGLAVLDLPAPLSAPAAAAPEDDTWLLSATLELNGSEVVAEAGLPLVWAGRRPTTVRLGSAAQAVWADRRWGGPDDLRAEATLGLDGAAFSLTCRVWDDVHVTDGNAADLYENDSIQVYFDFRTDRRGDRNYAPGVAAYVLAPNAAKDAVTVMQIAGNREISNRGVKAAWFTVTGVDAACRPEEGGYRITARFPYTSLGVPAPAAGDVLGFDIGVSDNDGTWYRNTLMLWSGGRGRRCYIRGSYHDPAEFGHLIVGDLGSERSAETS